MRENNELRIRRVRSSNRNSVALHRRKSCASKLEPLECHTKSAAQAWDLLYLMSTKQAQLPSLECSQLSQGSVVAVVGVGDTLMLGVDTRCNPITLPTSTLSQHARSSAIRFCRAPVGGLCHMVKLCLNVRFFIIFDIGNLKSNSCAEQCDLCPVVFLVTIQRLCLEIFQIQEWFRL